MRVIGLTGPSGAGKGELCRCLRSLGAEIIDCDEVYHGLLETSDEMLSKLSASFPEAFSDGRLDRRRLGRSVFADAARLGLLNGITHGYVTAEIMRLLDEKERGGCACAVIDAPALFESGIDRICDVTVFVEASESVRLSRIISRDGVSEEYARSRIAAQKKLDCYRHKCDIIIDNNGSAERLAEEAARILQFAEEK